MTEHREIRHFHLFGAIGGGAKGFMRGTAAVALSLQEVGHG